MSLPITIEGQKYFVNFPSLVDFKSFKRFLAREKRREMGDLIPAGLPDDELRRRLQMVSEEAEAIDPFSGEVMQQLLKSDEGLPLLLYAWLHNDSPDVTLTWVSGLIERAQNGSASAIDGVKQIKEAMTSLISAKKNEWEAAKKAKEQAAETQSISTPS